MEKLKKIKASGSFLYSGSQGLIPKNRARNVASTTEYGLKSKTSKKKIRMEYIPKGILIIIGKNKILQITVLWMQRGAMVPSDVSQEKENQHRMIFLI